MQGLSLQSLKKHKAITLLEALCTNFNSLIPLYVCTALGCGGAVFYLVRLATRSPEVTWSRKTNPEPWENYRDKQYKFVKTRDYALDESQAPKY